jgi:conjugative relaxase-like TrwC/TraI family protein
MMTLSKALTAGQATKYYEAEYTNARESYYSQAENIDGEWCGKLAKEWALEGAVDKDVFARLTEGQDPRTGEQLIRHITVKEYENQYGEKVKNSEHRAGYDATFSAPKSVSLAALVGDDHRIRDAHRTAVKTAMGELENYTQARMGGKTPAQTTRNFAAALFEHDSARPDKETGYAAPQLHTHAVIFNLTRLDDGPIKPIQPIELYRSQKYATAIYRAVLGEQLQKLGYEVEVDPRTGAPEIKGFSEEYLVASSPRRKQIEKEAGEIKERFAQQGILVKDGAGLNQAAAKLDRKSKRYDRTEMRARHQEMDARFENQAIRAADAARERGPLFLNEGETKKRAQGAVTFARQNAGAREAVVDMRKVMVDALRRNMSFTTHDAVVQELNQRVRSGEFIAIQRFDKFEELTTSQMLALERSNIHQMLAGRNTQEPMMQRKEASTVIKEIFERKGKASSFGQYKAVGTILVSRDRVFALEGLAGTGKTTALAILREAAERQGFAVRGLAPTGRAADKLAESGIKTTTLQGFLKEPELGRDRGGNRRLYVLDESSLSDTKNIHLFLQKAGPQSRILLVGDPAQHQAVEAGAPFEQLIKAGIRTARLDKILRQRSNLKKPVERLSQKEVMAAVAVLESQGRITEIKDDIDRLKAIATDYVNNPKSTLIISPANSERVAINNLIHHELQQRGSVSRENHRLTVLVNRQDMTGPERTFALAYVPGEDIIRYNTTSRLYGVKPGDYGRVLANDHKENTITVGLENGRELTYNPERLSGVSVYREAEREFAAGDRIQFRAPFAAGKVKNSELGTIKQIADDEMIVGLDKKRDVTINVTQFRHLDHGYAVTSHSSQGQTVNRVLVNAETTETDLLLNQRMAYVAISRARFEARVYTDSLKDLGPAFNRERNKEVALDALNESQALSPKAFKSEIGSTLKYQNNDASRPSVNPPSRIEAQTSVASETTGQATQEVTPFAERMQQLNQRLILGEKFSATLNEKYSAQRLQEVRGHRDFRRYSVMDQTTGLQRKMSINDVQQRAMAVAGRIADEQVSALDGGRTASMYQWREQRDLEYTKQIERHGSTLNEILKAHAAEVRKLTESLHSAQQTNLRATSAAQVVTNSVGNGQLSIPIIPHERLNELQLNAIHYRDVDAFEHLELIRYHLPHELGGPDRDSFSFARLRGQAILADSNVRVAEKRVEDLEKSRHFAKFEIDGQQWSLVRVDREQRLAERQIDFQKSTISAYRWRLYSGFQNPWKLRNLGEYRELALTVKESIANSREEIRNLQPIRAEVTRLIDEHRVDLQQAVRRERQMAHALNRSLDKENNLRSDQATQLLFPQFNVQELKHLEENSITLRDTQMLRLAEREMESHFAQTEVVREQLAARAAGRAEAADISLRDITQRLQSFSEKRDCIPVLIRGAEGDEQTTSLHDLQPRNITDKVFSYFSARDRLEINAAHEALDQQHADLLSERDALDRFTSSAREIAKSHEQLPLSLEQNISPADYRLGAHQQFTVREIAAVEKFAAQQNDAAIRAQFENAVQSALTNNHFGDFTELLPNMKHRNQQTEALESVKLPSSIDVDPETAKSMIDKVTTQADAEVRTLSDVTSAAESEVGSEAWAALL